ncbi:hypothetical protein VTK73DRAFT_3767 [Phialemonium thermophilum]|uniref:Uncharacterized protein n=1 Tax=Phialemonium thermophilum TaxID=223376 RepID=A0ABR3WX32_9PEZI
MLAAVTSAPLWDLSPDSTKDRVSSFFRRSPAYCPYATSASSSPPYKLNRRRQSCFPSFFWFSWGGFGALLVPLIGSLPFHTARLSPPRQGKTSDNPNIRISALKRRRSRSLDSCRNTSLDERKTKLRRPLVIICHFELPVKKVWRPERAQCGGFAAECNISPI